jgi:hypothetical protein
MRVRTDAVACTAGDVPGERLSALVLTSGLPCEGRLLPPPVVSTAPPFCLRLLLVRGVCSSSPLM